MAQAGNSTGFVQPTQVTGQNAFWAVVALALNAMTQPSIIEWAISDNAFEGSLVPHLSSPFVCLAETIMIVMWSGRLFFVYLRRHRRVRVTPNTWPDKTASPVALTMRLVVFTLAVLPQAIKVFAMQGTPFTKSYATIFLVSSIVNASLQAFRGGSRGPVLEFQYFINTIVREHIIELRTLIITSQILMVLAGIGHIVMFGWTWYLIAIHGQIPGCWIDYIEWTRGVCFLLVLLFSMQWLVCWAFRWQSPLPKIPGTWGHWAFGTLSLSSLFPDRHTDLPFSLILKAGSTKDTFLRTVLFVLGGVAVSLALTYALHAFAARLINKQPELRRPKPSRFYLDDLPATHFQNWRTTKWEPTSPSNAHSKSSTASAATTELVSDSILSPPTLATIEDWQEEPREASPRPSIHSQMGDLGNPLWDYLEARVSELPTEIIWIAFSIFNLLTATLYYLFVFDGTGTVLPNWVTVFG